jgi:hypothetical protein
MDEIEAILRDMEKQAVSVFDDFCVDANWELSAGEQEASIETVLPVNRVRTQVACWEERALSLRIWWR